MKRGLLAILACPRCKTGLTLKSEVMKRGETRTGSLTCKRCEERYPIENYIPRFVKDDDYVGSFSVEWDLFKDTQLDSRNRDREAEGLFAQHTGLDERQLKGAWTLDAGCGIGRFMEVAERKGANIVGLDMSRSVDNALKNLKNRKRVHLVQGDLMNPPFKVGAFGAVYSIGVLHHTPSTKRAFLSIAPLVKRGGTIAIGTYSDEGWKSKLGNAASEAVRFFTKRMDKRRLHTRCEKYVPGLLSFAKIPIIGASIRFLPFRLDKPVEHNVLEIFDWLSPWYQDYFTYDELMRWFEEAGLRNIRKNRTRVSVMGER